MRSSAEIVKSAVQQKLVIPAFNVPYLPMIQPVIEAVADQDSFAFVEVARPEWIKFESRSMAAVRDEFKRWDNPAHVRLHLDHIPVIDEDNLTVDYLPLIKEAIELGYHSVMLDGSRLSLADNIAATRQVAKLAHAAGIPCEAELGAVLGHEDGPLPPYEELFASGRGFTDVEQAAQFVQQTGCDWLSVAVGSIHGAISGVQKDQKKVAARLNIEHLQKLHQVTGGIPLVLHGGSGVQREYVLQGIKHGIAKINVGTEIRQAYEQELRASGDLPTAQNAVYHSVSGLLNDYFNLHGSRKLLAH